jgi:N-acetylmuramoyl-L-alanine amidase
LFAGERVSGAIFDMDDRRPTGAGPSRARDSWAFGRLAPRRIAHVAACCLALAIGRAEAEPAPPAEPVSAIAARIEQQKDRARLVFETTAEVTPTVFPVADPYRIVVDLPEMAFRLDPEIGRPAKDKRGGDEFVTSFRFGHFAPGRSRIVIDLARPAKIVRAESDSKLKTPRLVIELEPTDAANFAAEAARRAPAPTPRAAAEPPPPTPPGGKPMLVIDPGHGGVDVGAAGPHGEQEKTIVLEFARALKAKLEANGKLRVALTRNEDAFMALDERVRVARQAGAELFLSIHADTLAEPSVEGATVYTVSARASDAEAAKIAEKENFADRAAGLERKSEDAGEVGDILYGLTRRETRAYSHVFARTLIAYWQTVGHLNKNPSRSAGFVVLKTFDIPSVLLELGYLSSTRDLSRLVSPEWRERAAEATAQAIERYFQERQEQAQEQAGTAPQTAPAQAVAATARPQ